MPLMLGKREHQPGAISFRYSDIFHKDKLTKPPLVFGHIWNDTKVEMLGNDTCGCCVWATMAHLVQTMQRGLSGHDSPFSADSVIGDYRAVTGYTPGKPDTDTGTFMKDGASYWRKTGVMDALGNRHLITAYVEVRFSNPDELMQACFDFGGLALGLQLPQSAMDAFDAQQIWTVPFQKKIVGGHAVALVGRNQSGNAIIATWNGITAATPNFIRTFADEAVAFISLDYLDARGINPRGYDRAELEKQLTALA